MRPRSDFDADHGTDFAVSGDFTDPGGRTQAGEVRVILGGAGGGDPLPNDWGLPLIRSPEVLDATAAGTVTATVECPADVAGCTGEVSMRSAPGGGSYDLDPGERADVVLSLGSSGRRVLDRKGRLDDRVTVTAAGPGGRTLEREQRVTVLDEPEVPAAIDPSVADSHAMGKWEPTRFDTCPAELHDRFSVVGPDGKRYPTWHPPTVVDPATGRSCTFGHEHGPDPRGSDIHAWVSHELADRRHSSATGIPFGLAAEALDELAGQGTSSMRHEDHVGHKIAYVNDVRLLDTEGRRLGVTCDYLMKLHQGTHSADALANNVHELVYAMRCSDGAAVVSTTMVPFGAPGSFRSSCDPATTRSAGTTPDYPTGDGARSIPDRECIEEHILVPGNRGSAFWAIYENWQAEAGLASEEGELASFDADFAVFNPSRYAATDGTTDIGRLLDVCSEVEPTGDTANRWPCGDDLGAGLGFDHPDSPFDGARRELFIGPTTIRNQGGPVRWHTDPYGNHASPAPFPGSVRQYVAAVDTTDRPETAWRLFGRGSDLGGDGVHAPN